MRYEWSNKGNSEFAPEWKDWDELFCEIKIYWKTKAVRHWREETLDILVIMLIQVEKGSTSKLILQACLDFYITTIEIGYLYNSNR